MDDMLWFRQNGSYHCLGQNQPFTCAITDPHKVNYVSFDLADPPPTGQSELLHLMIENDCTDHSENSKCCPKPYIDDKYKRPCTFFTTGKLISRHAYTYGSFSFYALAVPEGEGDAPAIACFQLSNRVDKVRIEISICFSSVCDQTAQLLYQNGERKWSRAVMLPAGAGLQRSLYAISWDRCCITWFANLVPIGFHNVDSEDLSGKLRIKISIRPVALEAHRMLPRSYFKLIKVYRVSYTASLFNTHPPDEDTSSEEKTELFLKRNVSRNFTLYIVLLCLVITMVVYASYDFCNKRNDTLDAYSEILLDVGKTEYRTNSKILLFKT